MQLYSDANHTCSQVVDTEIEFVLAKYDPCFPLLELHKPIQ